MSAFHPSKLLAGLLTLAMAGSYASAGDEWLSDKASLKVELQITDAPSVPEAGIIAVIPDGGLLPGPAPDPVVYGADGKLLRSEVLWHNPEVGLAVVFQPPASGDAAAIYFRGITARQAARAKSEFCPSLLLFTRDNVTAASLEQAWKIPDTLAHGTPSRMCRAPKIGHGDNPLGKGDNYLSYYTGWIMRNKAARVWFATISDEGSDLRIDGKTIASWPGLHTRHEGAKGQFGGWVELSAGLHRIEYYHFEKEGTQSTQAAWRIPGETQGDLPVMIPPGAFLRSGQAIIKSAKFRDGRPVIAAGGYTQAVSYFWFLNVPVNLYHFDAELAACNPSNTVYAWNFGHEQIRRTPSLDWLIEGAAHHVISLTASNALGATRITVPVFAFGTQAKASINNLFERQAFRNALLTMCRAVPADKDPCALWSADLWATLVGVSEPYRGYDILREVFSRSTTIRKALAAPERQFLQDILIGCTRIMAPTNVPVWINRFVEENNDRAAKQHLEMERFDFTLYDIQDIQTARAQALEMQKRALTTDDTLLAQIRMGDVERASGNIEGAARIYSAAQDQYRNITRSGMTIQKLQSSAAAPGKPRDNKRLAEEAHADKPAVTLRATAQSWKTFAVQEAAFLATARNLIQKGYLFEARDILQKWELEVPLCKLNGEFPIAEAEYYIAAQHYVRAIAGLRIYRKSVDISGSLPEAMGLEMTCLIQLRRKQEAAELARDILKRIANHPVAEKARSVLEYGI